MLCSLVTSFSYAQTETEPNNTPDESGVITFTGTQEFFGNVSAVDPTDYWRIAKSPIASGSVSMSVISRTGSRQIPVFLEKRSGSYSGTLISEQEIHPGTDQSNRAFTLDYTGDFYYSIRLGRADGSIVGGYAYRVNFPNCRVLFDVDVLTSTPFSNQIRIDGVSAGFGSLYMVKINTINSFTDPQEGFFTPTIDGTNYSGSGEQIVYFGGGVANTTITNLSPNTSYYLKAWAYDDCDSGEFKRSTNGTVFTATTCGAAPATATALELLPNNENSAYVSSITGATAASTRFVVKVNTTNNFTAPTNGSTLPTTNTVYGGGEQVVYAGDSATPNALVTGLTTGTEYFFKVYSATLCGGTHYFESTGVTSSITPVCSAPNSNNGIYLYAEPTNLHNSIGVVNFTGNNNADGKIMYMSDANSFTLPTTLPVASLPTANSDYSGQTGQVAIYTGAATGFRVTTTGLDPNTTYYYAAVNYKECNGVLYFFPTGIYSQQTTCGVTSELASGAVVNNVDATAMDLNSFTASTAAVNAPDGYVIKMNTTNSFTPLAIGTALPSGNTVYGGGEQVIYSGTSVTPNLNITGLSEGTQYFFTIYGYKDCNGTPVYQQTGYTFSQFTLGLNFTPPTLTYGSGATTLNATTTSTGAISYSLVNDTTGASIVGSDITPGNRGTTTVRVTVAADGIYQGISKDYSVNIVKGNPIITWNPPASIEAGVPIDASYLNAVTNVTGTFEYYQFYNSNNNTFSQSIIEGVTFFSSFFPIGNLYTRFVPDDINYNVAVGSTSISVVTSNIIEILPNDAIKALGGSDPALTHTMSGTLTGGDVIWVPLKREPGETLGTYVISVDQTAQAPASFDRLGVCPAGICIGRENPFGDEGEIVSTTGNYDIRLQTGTFTISDKEQVTITLNPSDLGTSNYTGNPRNAITASSITVTATGNPASPAPNLIFTYSGNNYLGNPYGPSTTPPTNAGFYAVTASVDPADVNYFGSATGNFRIEQYRFTITPDNPQVKAYDGSPKAFEATVTGLSGENVPVRVLYDIDLGPGILYTEAAPTEVGQYTVSILTNGAVNYYISYEGSFTITDKQLVTINLADLTQSYDGTPKPVTISSIETSPGVAATPAPTVHTRYQGINGTFYSLSSIAPRPAGEYKVSVYVDAADANFAGATHQVLTIQDKTLVTFTMDPADLNATYNGNAQGVDITSIKDDNGIDVTPTYTVMYSGEDSHGNSYGPSATPPTNAGDYTIVAEVDAADPTYRGRNEEDFTINEIALTLTADAKSKTYGDADPALTYQLTSGALIGGDVLTGDLSRVAGENVGTYAIQQGTVTAGVNYNITFVSNDVTIGQRAIEVTADAKSKIYGDADPALTYQITSGNLVGSDAFIGIMTRIAGEDVGTYAIQQDTFTAGANYNLTFVPNDVTITPRAIEITADAKSKTYGDADPALTYQITSGALQFSDVFTGTLTRVLGEDAGTYAIQQGTISAGSNYTLSFVPNDLTIGQRAIEITVDAKLKTYGDADPALTYQITVGGLQFSDSFTGSLSRVAGEDVGNYAIQQGTVTAGDNYNITFVTNDLTIGQRAIQITADALNKVYGDADPAFTYQITSGSLVFSDAFTGSLTRVAGENVGNYAINQGTVALNANYNLTYVGDDLTIGQRAIEVTADAKSKIYGDADPALTYQITSGSLVGSDAFIGIMTRVAGENVGTYAILQDTFTAGANYNIAFISNDLTIGQRAIEVTADAKTKTYGDADPTLTYQITSGALQFSDAFTGVLSRDAGQAQGNYAINQGTLSLGGNYNISFVSNNLSIGYRHIIIAAVAPLPQKVYGDADPSFNFPYRIVQGSLAFDDSLETLGTSRFSGEDVGSYRIGGLEARFTSTNGGESSYTYSFTGAASIVLQITPRALEVTADAKSKTYGDADPTLSYQITNGALQFSDAFTGNLNRVTGEDVGTYAINQGTLSAGSNYTMTYVGNSLTIDQRAIEITADALNKAYGDTDPALTYQITTGSLAFSDAFTGSLTRVAGEDLGTYAINQGTVALNANYNLTYVGANFEITQRPITLIAEVKSKTYGDADPALTYGILSGSLVNSDVLTGALTREPGENVGFYRINLGTIDNPNYNISFIPDNLNISARDIEVTADAKSKTYGDVDPALTYQLTSGTLQFSDALSGSLSRVAGEDAGNYAIQQGSVTAGGNYNIAFVANDLTIGQRAIEVTADAKNKEYGNADPAFTYQITSGSLAGSDTLTGNLDRATGEDVGTYAINQGTLDNSNYAITFIGNDLSITVRTILVAPSSLQKIYGESDPELNFSILGPPLVFGDTFTGSLSRAAGEDVGSYEINQGTLSLNNNYSVFVLPSRFTINPRSIEITADVQSKTYGDTDLALTYQITNGSLAFSDAFTGSLTRIPGEDVGAYAIQQGSVALNANYDLSYIGNDFTIGQRVIEITADAKSKTYGDTDPTLTYQITSGSLLSGDTVTGSLTRMAGENAGNYAIQQGSVAVNANYAINFVSNDLAIGQRAIEVTADAQSKTYGDIDPALTYQLTAGTLQLGDALSGSLSRIAGEDAGNYAIQQGTVTAGSNYNINFISNDLTIGQRAIEITADAASKTFGDADPALTYQITAGVLQFGDIFSGSLSRVVGEDVGNYAIQQGSLTLGTNYSISYTGNTLTIGQASQSITFGPLANVNFGNSNFNLNATASSGLLVSYTSSDPSVATVSGNTVTIIGMGTTTITASQAGDANWNAANDVTQVLTVTEGCPINELPIDNFEVQAYSETCTDKNNGAIFINAVQELDYVTTINNQTYNFSSHVLVTDLEPGTYPVCISIEGYENCEQCFELVIEEAPILDGKTSVSGVTANKQVVVEIETGTAPFTVSVNDQVVGEFDTKTFLIEAQNGDKIDVTSSVACEGKISTAIDLFDQMSVFPNPTKANVTLALPKFGSNMVAVSIHNAIGTVVSSNVYSVVASKVELPMENLPTGVYFVTINEGTSRTFKIIKE
ncbi:hypothetical protein GCM10022258_36340 [Aquimarina gracilis]